MSLTCAPSESGTTTEIVCPVCKQTCHKATGAVNRARRKGAPMYCSRKCTGIARRANKSDEQKKAEKAEYDRQYRAKNKEMLKAKKAAYFQRTYDPAKAAIERKKRMHKHVEYCRRPEYRAWKKEYDRRYQAEKSYGEFAECHLLAMDIRDECLKRMSDYDIRLEKGTLNKQQKRRRDYDRTQCNKPETGALGNLERGETGKNGTLASGQRSIPSPRDPEDHQHSTSDRTSG